MQTLTGTNATDPTTTPQASCVVDGDPGNAANLAVTPLQAILNAIGWLRAKCALLNMGGGVISNHGTPAAAGDVANKSYVDAEATARANADSTEATTRANADSTEATNRANGDSSTLASAKAYTDGKTLQRGAVSYGADVSWTTGSCVRDPVTGQVFFHIEAYYASNYYAGQRVGVLPFAPTAAQRMGAICTDGGTTSETVACTIDTAGVVTVNAWTTGGANHYLMMSGTFN